MCGIPWETFIVRWNGEVIPCSNCFSLGSNDDIILGDANVEKLSRIWHGKKLLDLRKRTENWLLDGTICEKCERWNMYNLFPTEIKDGLQVKKSGIFSIYSKSRNNNDKN
jgi:radical SAM protein with 4Fe4S-binding SPASM domain